MLKKSLMICVAFAGGGIAAGCTGESSAPDTSDPLTEPVVVDETEAQNRAAPDQDLLRNAQDQSVAAPAPVTVKYVIDVASSAQSVARSGIQSAASGSTAPPEAPGVMRAK